MGRLIEEILFQTRRWGCRVFLGSSEQEGVLLGRQEPGEGRLGPDPSWRQALRNSGLGLPLVA